MDAEDITIDKPKVSEEPDVTEAARQLLCEAAEEANKKAQDKDAVVEEVKIPEVVEQKDANPIVNAMVKPILTSAEPVKEVQGIAA